MALLCVYKQLPCCLVSASKSIFDVLFRLFSLSHNTNIFNALHCMKPYDCVADYDGTIYFSISLAFVLYISNVVRSSTAKITNSQFTQ